MSDPSNPTRPNPLRRRVLLLALFSTLTLAAAATFTTQRRASQAPPAESAGPRTLSAPLFTPRRVPRAFSGLLSRARLNADLSQAPITVAGLQVCVEARTVGSGEVLFGLNADRPAISASTMKLLTGAAALEVLGLDYRFATTARIDGEMSGGTILGALYLVGGGDGLLSTPQYATWEESRRPAHIPVPPRTDITSLARSVKSAGITRIAGPIVGDASFFDDQRVHPGWKQAYFDDKIIAPITGLAINRNLVGWGNGLESVGFAGDPVSNAAELFRQVLIQGGVEVEGPALAKTVPASARVLATLYSVPLPDVVRHIEQASDNYLAENVLKTLGRVVRDDGSFVKGAEVVVETLAARGVAVNGLVMSDGSGLARSSLVPCTLLADLLARNPSSPGFRALSALLSVSGESGTLKQRFPEPELRGKVRGKTGSLEGVSNLAGLVFTADRSAELAFAVLVTGDDGALAVGIQRRVIEQLLRFPALTVTPAG